MHVRLDLRARLAQRLPVARLSDDQRALAADDVGGAAHVAAQLLVRERRLRRLRKVRRVGRVADVDHRAACAGGGEDLGQWRQRHVRLPVRASTPPICIRQELSVAVHTSAPVATTRVTLSAAIAVDTSAFLTANVPPKPQH